LSIYCQLKQHEICGYVYDVFVLCSYCLYEVININFSDLINAFLSFYFIVFWLFRKSLSVIRTTMPSIINYLLFVVVLLCISSFLQQGSLWFLVICITYLFTFLVTAQHWPKPTWPTNKWPPNSWDINRGPDNDIQRYRRWSLSVFSLCQTDPWHLYCLDLILL
jgi:uncharacterized membrane protein